MTKLYLLLLVACLFIVAYPALVPDALFYSSKVPSWFSDWMKYVPVALFAALLLKMFSLLMNIWILLGISK